MGASRLMFAVVYLPDFFLQAALRHEPALMARAVALVDESLPKPVITQLTEAARASGVCAGLTSTQAMARCREVIIRPRSAAQEAVAADTLLQCGYLISPYVEATAPGICTLDLKGQSGAGDETFGWQVAALLDQFQLRAQIGVAASPAVALHAARRATPFLAVNDAAGFLGGLPIESLDPAPELLGILHKWGIRNIDAFLRLGRDAVAERLGAEALELFRRASPSETRPLRLTHPVEIFEETFEFETEIETLEPLLFILRRFVEQIALRLTVSCFAAEELFFRLTLADGSRYERPFKIPAPTADLEALLRMLYTHLESLKTEHPIKAVYLSARPCRPDSQQFSLFECALRDPNRFYETLGRLTALLGADRVGTPVVQPTHRPDAFHMKPVDCNASFVPRRGKNRGGAGNQAPDSQPTEKPTPSRGLSLRRFRPPLPAQVDLEAGRPCGLRSSLFHGRIRDSAGPWRISGQWWERLWQRDEWDVETNNGQLYRLYCEENNWFMDGVYD